ncbi:DUF3168 domain-containing protein [Paracoccus sp. (in: a-proteobacteria)]|uniref:DUF3168 domain-containing protein n=1 Tax=Paracoccus sp. TaxID=267 RepID=UPI00321F86A2
MDRLIAQVGALGGRVYDRAIEANDYPYITLGPSYWTDDSVECVKARAVTLQVDVWCSGAPGAGKGNAEDVIDDVAAALDGWADTVALTMHPARLSLVRVMDDPSGCIHGVVQIEALLEG